MEMGRGRDAVVAAIGADGVVEGLADRVVGYIEPFAGCDAAESHGCADGDALPVDLFQHLGHRGRDPVHVVLEVAAGAFDAGGVEDGDRRVEDGADVVHAGLDDVVAGDELAEGRSEGLDDVRSAVGRDGGHGDAVLDAEDLDLGRVDGAAGVEEGLCFRDDDVGLDRLLPEDVVDLERTAGAPGVEHDDLSILDVRGHLLGKPGVPGRRDDDHDDVGARNGLLHVGGGKLEGAGAPGNLFAVVGDQLDGAAAADRLEAIGGTVE
jgi:hypothetical protein